MISLKKDGLREQLELFHQKFYSSNLMSLVVHSPKDLESLEELVRKNFEEVPNFDAETRFENWVSPFEFPT